MIIEEITMTEPALLINDQPLSHVARRTPTNEGIWYAGSSITKGAGSPANALSFLRIIPERIIDPIPIKYALAAIHGDPPKMAPAISPIIGSFAPQGINVVVMTVSFLSLSFSIVREAIIPGTPHPVATRQGINDLPDNPN